jgi:TolB-like protein/DNA-binding winged helix-turn-helix (wHTH) protein/Flp pilus assembly protein TadD
VATNPAKIQGTVRFGEGFELDSRAYKLRRSGRVLKVERIPMEVLVVLVERRGDLVTREQLVEKIWGKGVFLDTDNSINGAISKIRQVLKDDPEQPLFIQTVTGRGYRFIAPVMDAEDQLATPPRSASGELEVGKRATGRLVNGEPTRLRWLTLAGVGICLIAALGAGFLWSRSRAQSAGRRVMLAVLPFENLTGDAGQDYFSDGLTEEMIAKLGNLDPQHIGVIARTSVMHYKHSQESLEQIGRELGVQYVMEGSVRRDSDRVRITAQLIQMRDQSHLWAQQYDRDLNSLLAVQGEIAQEVADEIQSTLGGRRPVGGASQSPLSPNAFEAYDLYLKGRYFWNKRTAQSIEQAIEYFQQAIGKDPGFARAYAGLADSYALLSGFNQTPQTESMPKARTAALKALELDEGLAEAHTSLALITETYDWDWQTAEKEYRRAIELNPNYATAHQWYAEYLSLQGRFDEAFAESERARQLDPLSLIIATDNGMILYYSRQYDRAIAQFRAVLEMEPNFQLAHVVAGAYVEQGRFADALAEARSLENVPWMWSWQAYIHGRAGQQEEARHALEKLQQIYRSKHLGPDPILWAYIGMGDKDKAFLWFERAYADHSNFLTTLKVNPACDPLRSDPRFHDLERRVGLDR